VGGLRRQLAEATKQQKAKASVLQQPAAEDPMEKQKEIAIAKMNYTKYWMVAFVQFANQHQGQLPTTFEQATAFMPDEIKGQTNVTADQFEIVYQGSLNDISHPARVIVIREKEAWQTPDGGWARDYAFADGHCEIHKTDDGNFEPWESQHMMASVAGQPAQ
jgi:prepilin-type processing-associated H-X9-DG protein